MRKVLKFSFLVAALATVASVTSTVKAAKPTEAKGINTTFDYSAKDLLANIYNNDLDDVTVNESFDYGARHGHLNTGDSPAVGKFTTKGDNPGDMSSGSGATSDWGGARLTSVNDDRFIFKFVAKTPISISVLSSDGAGWVADSNVACYVVKSDIYSEDVPSWMNNGEEKKSVNSPSTSDDFSFTTNLNIGEVLYYQWGFQWTGDSRTFQIDDSSLRFSIKCAPEVFTMKSLLTEITTEQYGVTGILNRKNYSVKCYHGAMDGQDPHMTRLVKSDGPNEGELSGNGDALSDWAGARLQSKNGDYFMIKFECRSFIKIGWDVSSFTGGIDGSQLKIYKCGDHFDDDPEDCDDFSLISTVNLSTGEVSDACGSCDIGPDESLVWAWGSEDADWARTWETENSNIEFGVRAQAYEKLQEEANAIEPLARLGYTYTVSGNTYSDVSFKMAIGFNFGNLKALDCTHVGSFGVTFKSMNENMKESVSKVYCDVYSFDDTMIIDDDNEMIYTVLDFGDVLNNPTRLLDPIKFSYFVSFGDFVIESTKSKMLSIYSMVMQYSEMGEPVQGLAAIVETLTADL